MNHDYYNPKNNKNIKKKGVDSFLIGIIMVTLLILGGGMYFGSKIGATSQVTADSQVRMMIKESRYDWGTIDINGGIVNRSFTIENNGSTTLKLYDVKTSCMCTTAQLKTAEQVSKKFGMNGNNSSVFEVKPGETAQLIVEYDPLFHGPSGVGSISRTVTLNTNSAESPSLSFQVNANVVKK